MTEYEKMAKASRVTEVTEEVYCNCSALKCGPHRCRASMGWLLITLALATYLIFMHSQWHHERQTGWTQQYDAWSLQANTEWAKVIADADQRITLRITETFEAQTMALQEAADYFWMYHTPPEIKDMEILRRLRTLERTRISDDAQ